MNGEFDQLYLYRKAVVADRHNPIAVITLSPTLGISTVWEEPQRESRALEASSYTTRTKAKSCSESSNRKSNRPTSNRA